MTEKIYIRNASGELEPLAEERFETEALLQELIGQHPELLAGDQMRPDDPLRWIIIRREMPIEGWAVDHLLIDHKARPTLVEVKRGSNREIRRNVVGQMLDYAATAAGVWSERDMRRVFEESHDDPDEVISALLQADDEPDIDAFWEQVATSLATNQLRLLFVADEIPTELERVVKFLNEQTRDNLEVLAVEVKQYPGKFGDALVSRVIGLTDSQDRNIQGMGAGRHNMSHGEFLSKASPEVQQAANTLIEAAQKSGGFITPSAGGIRVRGRCKQHNQPITVAQFYAPTENRLAEFDFRVRFDYANQELQQLLNNWLKRFETDRFVEQYTRYNWLTGWTVQATAVSQNADLLAGRLADVLTNLQDL